jgi:TolB-like protein/tetratricopeptide (TPR) repeat protein
MAYRFEDYSLDTDRRELRREGKLVAVAGQVFDVLEYLVRNNDRIVTKDDLIAGVWNGRIVSDSTLSSRITMVRHAVGDDGKQQRLVRTVSRRGFRFVGHVQSGQPQSPTALFLSARPSLAILPFANRTHDSEQDDFVSGLVEDITTALAQFHWLSVIARESSLVDQGFAVDIKQTSQELGAHYVLEGSLRKSGSQLRVTARLIDTTTRTHLWASRFDDLRADILSLQDHIATSVVAAVWPKLEQAAIDRAAHRPDEINDAMNCYMRGMGNVYRWSKGGISDALGLFRKAIQIDPEFAPAYGMAAYCYIQRKSYGWIGDRAQETAECERLSRQAAELARGDALALSKAAHAISSVPRDVDSGAVFIDQALQSDPNFAGAWYVSGWIRVFLGRPDVAIEHLEHAIRLSPFDPLLFKMRAGVAYAHFFAGRYDEAAVAAVKALHARPKYLTAVRAAAASHALAGRIGEARMLISQMREMDPALRVSGLSDLIPLYRSEDLDRWSTALRGAGLPD